MVDELDSVAGTKDSDLNCIFRQGYRRGLKYSRVNPNTLETESFEIFGPKLFTVHTEIEEALQTRTIPIHVRETSKLEVPIINLDRTLFAQRIYTENFLWYLDNILIFAENNAHNMAQLDILDMFPVGDDEELTPDKIRHTIYKRKRALVKECQVSQVCQVGGRNVELMFLCFALSNLIGVECDSDIVQTFNQKLLEENEKTELGYLGLLKQLLIDLYHEKRGKEAYTTEEGFVKVSNKEIYDRFNKILKEEYGRGISPVKFKEFMLQFGFTDALNRRKLEVPTPEDPKPKSRLCNIYTNRVLRKLGIQHLAEKPAISEIIQMLMARFSLGTQSDFEKLATKYGLKPQEAENLFSTLVEHGKLALGPDGLWRWI